MKKQKWSFRTYPIDIHRKHFLTCIPATQYSHKCNLKFISRMHPVFINTVKRNIQKQLFLIKNFKTQKDRECAKKDICTRYIIAPVNVVYYTEKYASFYSTFNGLKSKNMPFSIAFSEIM